MLTLSKEQIKVMVETMTPEQIKTECQNLGYQAWKAAGCRGSMEMATGTGKTRIALLAAHAELQLNPQALVVIVVPTETMRDEDWPDEMRLMGLEYLVDKTIRLCWASLNKFKPGRDVDLFVGDEWHHLTIASYGFFTQDWKVFRILGLSATLPDADGYEDDKTKRMLIDSLAPSVFKIPLETAITLKLVSDFKVTVLLFDLDDKDPYVDGGTKAKPVKTTEIKQYAYLSKNLQRAIIMGKVDKRKAGMQFMWIQKRTEFLYNLRQKAILAREVMSYVTKDKRTLIFCGSIEQSEQLCGEWVYNSSTTDKHLTLFQEKKIDYLGVVQALNEGKNVVDLDQILVIQLSSKGRTIIQRIGRTVRWREGHLAEVIVLVAKGTVDEKWYKSAFESFDKSRITEYYVRTESKPA